MEATTLGEALLAVTSEHALDKVATLKRGADGATWAALGVASISVVLNATVISSTVYCLIRVRRNKWVSLNVSVICESFRAATVQGFPSFVT